MRAYYKIREARVRKRIFEMVKAVGATSHSAVLGGRKGRSIRRARNRQHRKRGASKKQATPTDAGLLRFVAQMFPLLLDGKLRPDSLATGARL